MSYESTTDAFIVANGPEDGAEFPVTKGRFEIGHGSDCLVSVRLDETVGEHHARATVVSDGYLIRACGPNPVFVNGHRVGLVTSRIVRQGGRIQVGGTMLVCRCAPEGLARRSRGIRHTNDLAWGLLQAAAGLGWLTARLYPPIRRFFRFRLSGMMLPLFLLVGFYLFYPPFRHWSHELVAFFWGVARALIGWLFR